jgi:hypothetical protein
VRLADLSHSDFICFSVGRHRRHGVAAANLDTGRFLVSAHQSLAPAVSGASGAFSRGLQSGRAPGHCVKALVTTVGAFR